MTMTAAIDFLLVPFPWDHSHVTSALHWEGSTGTPKRDDITHKLRELDSDAG